MRGAEIAGIERGFVSVEKRENAEDLIVERAFEGRAADAMAEAPGFAPDFLQHAVKGFQGKLATVFRDPIGANDASGFKVGRDEHRVPRDVHRLVDKGSGTLAARFHHLALGLQFDADDFVFLSLENLSDLGKIASDPKNIFCGIVMHFTVGLNIVVELDYARFFGCEDSANFVQSPREIVAVVIQRVVGILAGIEAAILLVGENQIDP